MVLGLSFLQGLGVYWKALKQSKVPEHCKLQNANRENS